MKRLCFSIAICSLFLVACSKDSKPTNPKPGQGHVIDHDEPPPPDLPKLKVINENLEPIAGAKILIGDSKGNPFPNNFLTTDSSGQVTAPASWQTALPVTVQASGYTRLTYLQQPPKALTLRLRPLNTNPKYLLDGKTTSHPVTNYDGYADFGLVMEGLTRNDLMALDLTKIISTQVDTLTVLGQKLEIPSNVTVPDQWESYIFPLHLNKPSYRLLFNRPGPHRVYAAQARFELKPVVDQLRQNKKFYELINYFSITGGVIRDIDIKNTKTTLDLPTNEMQFKTKLSLKSPPFSNDEIFVAMATADLNGWLIPTDMKRMESETTANLSVAKTSPYAVGILKKEIEFEPGKPGQDRVSATLMEFKTGLKPKMLPLIQDPSIAANGDLLLDRPKNTANVAELATYATFSEIQEIPVGTKDTMKVIYPLWEVYVPVWIDTLTLPQWPDGTPRLKRQRWDITYIGSNKTQTAELGQPVIEAATHATHSSLDY